MSIESVMPSSHLILCRPLLQPPNPLLSRYLLQRRWMSRGQARKSSTTHPQQLRVSVVELASPDQEPGNPSSGQPSSQESMGLGHCLNNVSRNACFLAGLPACCPLNGPSWLTSQLLLLPKFKANRRHYNKSWDFHGGPVVKAPSSQCRGLGFHP